MTTVREIVSLALRQAKVYAPGEDVSDEDAAEGLTAFQSMLDQWVVGGMFGTLTDTYQTEDYVAAEGERVITPPAVGITYPDTVEDAETGDTRAPRDLAIIEAIPGGVREVRVYDRTDWARVTGLTLSSDAPFALRGKAGLAACVALAYAEMFGAELGPHTQRLALRFMGALSGKMGTTQPKSQAEYF